MFRDISKKYMKRSRVKTLVLMILICLITVFMVLGVGMLVNSQNLLRQADEAYTTVGILEYTAGEYPYERGMKAQSLQAIEKFPLDKIRNQEEVKAFRDNKLLMGYVDGVTLTTYFNASFYNHSVIEFQILYGTDDGGFRCTLTKSYYSNTAKDGKTFGLSFRDQKEKDSFKLEIGHKYLASGDFRNEKNLLMFRPVGVSSLVDNSKLGTDIAGYPAVDITNNPNYMEDEKTKKAWQNICDFYKVQNGSFQVHAADSVKTNRDFYLGNNYLKQGQLWTDEEGEKGEKVCVIHAGIASILNKKVGDQIELSVHFSNDSSNFFNSYDPNKGFADKKTYRIKGIYDSIQDENDPYIYIPSKSLNAFPDKQKHFYMGSVVIKNGKAEKFQEKVQPLMKDNFRITVYDQGYAQTAAPIKAMKNNAILIISLCGCCCVAILMLFANLFVNKQQESIAVMTALGTTKKDIRCYIMHGASTILGVGASVGCIIGFFSAKGIISVAYQLSQKVYAQDLRFSSLRMGVQLPFEGKIESSILIAVLVCVIMVGCGTVICHFTANKLIRMTANFGGNISKKKKRKKEKVVQAASTPKESFTYKKVQLTKASFFPGKKVFYALKQSMRSIRRNGKTSSVLLLISVAITVFIVFYNQGISSFENKLEQTYKNAKVDGYFSTITSQQMDARGVNAQTLEMLRNSKNVKTIYPSSTCSYEYVDKLSLDGTIEEQKKELERVKKAYELQMKKPAGSFGMEARISQIRSAEKLIATQKLERSREFFQNTKPVVEYMEGYENFFEKKSIPAFGTGQKTPIYTEITKNVIPVILNQKLAKVHNIKMGDVIMISKVEVLGEEGMNYASNEQLCHVVGTYQSKTSGMGIYTLYPKDGLTILAENPYDLNRLQEYHLGDSYINYRLDNVKDFTKLRDKLEENGVSPIGVLGVSRTCFVIDDKEMVQTVDNIQNNISFMRMLRYALFLLVFFIGFISAFMTMRTRKTEIAIIRSLGTGKVRTFFMFFLEYAAIGLAGVLLAMVILYANMGSRINGQYTYVLIFYISFLIGSGLCVARMNRSNVLEILTNAE